MKTVSLTDALKSGKKFKWKMPQWNSGYMPGEVRSAFGVEEILHAECQIIEEPREFWFWQYPCGTLASEFYVEKQRLKDSFKEELGRPVKFREVIDE